MGIRREPGHDPTRLLLEARLLGSQTCNWSSDSPDEKPLLRHGVRRNRNLPIALDP